MTGLLSAGKHNPGKLAGTPPAGLPAPAPFSVADELTCYYDRPGEPANVHVEARVAGPLDEGLIRAAVDEVLAAEPGLRARRLAGSYWRRGYQWEYPAVTDIDPVQLARYRGEAELASLRSTLLSHSPSLDRSPPVRFMLATGPAGDVLILNAHHACFDGLAALRLLRAVADAYTGLAGERPDAGAMPPRPEPVGQGHPGRGPARKPAGASRLGGHARIAADLEPGSAGPLPGYGAQQLSWDGLAQAGALRSAGYSVNDLLIAALVITIIEWNQAHGTRGDAIRITMPVGDSAQAEPGGAWANRSRLTTVTAAPRPGAPWSELLDSVASQTRYAKDNPGPQVDLLSTALTKAPVPATAKKLLLRTALRVAGPVLCDTSLISNLGVVRPVRFGSTAAFQVWFSTSAHLPRGLSVGAVTTGDRLRLTFRYRRALLSDPAAAAFAASYGHALDVLTGRDAPG